MKLTKYVYVVLNTIASNQMLSIYSNFETAKQFAEKEVAYAKKRYEFEWDFYGTIEIYKVEIDKNKFIDCLSNENCVWSGK